MNKKKSMLLILGMMGFLANGDNYAAAPLLVNIAGDLNISVTSAAMSVTAYMLTFGAFTLFFGPISDRYGKVKVMNIAAFGTSIFSILGATTFNLSSLIFFRAMNGAFAAGIFPIAFALIGESFHEEEKPKAMSKFMGFMFLGASTASITGGILAYLGSWRLVYFIYGVGELIITFIMMKYLERDKPITDKLDIVGSYNIAFKNFKFMRNAGLIFLVGAGVYGSFTFSGKLIREATHLSVLYVGLILSVFGIGTVLGGKLMPTIKNIFKNYFLIFGGILGGISLFTISISHNYIILMMGFLGFGISYNLLQSTLIFLTQNELLSMKGTAMSVASFNMFVGGAVGVTIGGYIIRYGHTSTIFANTSIIFILIAIGGSLVFAGQRKK